MIIGISIKLRTCSNTGAEKGQGETVKRSHYGGLNLHPLDF